MREMSARIVEASRRRSPAAMLNAISFLGDLLAGMQHSPNLTARNAKVAGARAQLRSRIESAPGVDHEYEEAVLSLMELVESVESVHIEDLEDFDTNHVLDELNDAASAILGRPVASKDRHQLQEKARLYFLTLAQPVAAASPEPKRPSVYAKFCPGTGGLKGPRYRVLVGGSTGRELDVTGNIVGAIAHALWQARGGDAAVNWWEAERMLNELASACRIDVCADADEAHNAPMHCDPEASPYVTASGRPEVKMASRRVGLR